MAQDRVKQLLQQGIAAAKANQKDQARQILQRAVKLDPRNETAWLWLSSVAGSDQERIFCLKQLYAINPNNEMAIKGLRAFGIDPTAQPPAQRQQQSDTPQVTADKLRAIQGQIDNIISNYRPELYTPLEIDWVKKEKNRYGEATARRIKRTFYGTVGAAGLLFLAVVGFGLVTLLGSLGGEEEQTVENRGLFTATPSLVPTITPTPTINPNTPIPTNVFTTPTPVQPPNSVPRGQEGIEPTPTNVYPVIQQAEIRDALVFFNEGDYERVREISEPFQGEDAPFCLPELYYYDAVGRARLGGDDNIASAQAILQRALSFEERAGFQNECSDPASPLLLAGLCVVQYEEAIQSSAQTSLLLNQAVSLCQNAHTADLELVSPAITLADIYLAQGEVSLAIETLLETLNYERESGVTPNIGNVELLLKLADAEAQQGDFGAAQSYISTALFIDPVLEEGLIRQVELTLAQAQATEDDRLRQVLYGYSAVLAEEQYLSRYPGSAIGYVYVAEGRLREGNPERALDSLERVIQVEGEMGVDEVAVQQAYALRAEIAFAQQDFSKAVALLNDLVNDNPENIQWHEWRYRAALQINDYDVASDSLDYLLTTDTVSPEWVVDNAMLRSQVCQYTTGLRCDFGTVLTSLNDEFIASLTDDVLVARATAYRVEAAFADLSAEPSTNELTLLLEQLEIALQQPIETGENYYLLGRLYAGVENYAAALDAYQWVIFWDRVYNYPFTDDVEDAIEAVETTVIQTEEA